VLEHAADLGGGDPPGRERGDLPLREEADLVGLDAPGGRAAEELAAEEDLVDQAVVLAYSGGLDTACILKVLLQRGYEVIAYVA
jgi:hypothetical protein